MAKAKVMKVHSAEKTHERVWNVTDDPRTKVTASILMIMGKNIAPGRPVKVPLGRLKGKRLEQMKEARQVHVGPTLPQDYLVATDRLHVRLPRTSPNRHGASPERKTARAARMMKLRESQAKAKEENVKKAEMEAASKRRAEMEAKRKSSMDRAAAARKEKAEQREATKAEIAKRTGGATREAPTVVEKVAVTEEAEVIIGEPETPPPSSKKMKGRSGGGGRR